MGPHPVDRLSGGTGDDTLNTVDGTTDDYACGSEHVAGDACTVDPGDSAAQCEGGVVTIWSTAIERVTRTMGIAS